LGIQVNLVDEKCKTQERWIKEPCLISREVHEVEGKALSIVLLEEVDWLAVFVPVSPGQRLHKLLPVLIHTLLHHLVRLEPM